MKRRIEYAWMGMTIIAAAIIIISVAHGIFGTPVPWLTAVRW